MHYSARWIAALQLLTAVLGVAMPGWSPTIQFSPAMMPADGSALLTFPFAANTLWDTAVAAVVLASFGPEVERQLGRPKLWAIYLTTAVAGGATALAMPGFPAGGALAGAIGLLVVYAHFWPLNRVPILGFTAIGPRELLAVLLGYRLFFGLGGSWFDAAPFAGLAAGLLWLAALHHTSAASQYRRRLQTALVGDRASWADVDWDAIPRDGLHPITLEELDRVIAKGRAHGVRALTEEERAFLHRMRLRQPERAGAIG